MTASERRKKESELIATFQKANEELRKSGKSDNFLENIAVDLLETTASTVSLRRLIAEYLYRIDRKRSDWLGLATAIDLNGPEFLVAFTRRWLDQYGSTTQIKNNIDEFIFYSSFVQKISKNRTTIRKELSDEEYKELKRNLTFTLLTLSELRDDNFTSTFKALVKLNGNEEEYLEMAWICYDVSIFLPGNLLLLSLISKEMSQPFPFLEDWLSAIPIWVTDQELASASSPIVAEFLRHFPEKTIKVIVPFLISKNNAILANVLRCWVHRWTNIPNGLEAVILLLKELEERCKEELFKPKKKYWPVQLEYFEDFTCIDPLWEWEESSGILWLEDRLLRGFLNVWETLYEKFNTKKAREYCLPLDNEVLQAALAWHDEEIRQIALKLLRFIEGGQEIQDKFTTEIATKAENEPLKNEKVFLPDNMEVPALPEEYGQIIQSVDVLLKLHGSEKEGHVPSLAQVHRNLENVSLESVVGISEHQKKIQLNERILVKILSDAIERISGEKEISNLQKTLDIFHILSRTRLKAVVNAGCTIMESVLCVEDGFSNSLECLFDMLLKKLIDARTEIRTLVLSRLLWCCCINKHENFSVFFERIEPFLTLKTDSVVLARILKTLKHFVSQADCQESLRSKPVLFDFCLEAQKSENFLVRSASIIVFGFMLRAITRWRKLPLFVLIGSKSVLWNLWREEKLQKLATLSRPQRILLLTLLKQYILVHKEFYSDRELLTLAILLEQVNLIRLESPDVRERRFCVEILLQLTPTDNHDILRQKLNEGETLNNREDLEYFDYRLGLLNIPDVEVLSNYKATVKLAEASEYSKMQQRIAENPENVEILTKLAENADMENELAAQNLVIALETVVRNHGCDFPGFSETFSKLKNHKFPRVRTLASRIPVAAKKEIIYKSVDLL